MRRIALALVLVMLLPSVVATPDATVDLTIERRIGDVDLGINGGEMSPDKKTVLIYGAEGFAHLISATNADDDAYDVLLENETELDLRDVSWHPAGKSALIVGDGGTVLRYNSTNYAIGEVSGTWVLGGTDLSAVQYTPGSSVAYIGGADGSIWKYQSDTITHLSSESESKVTDIACMRNENICVIATLNDGLAVIDQSDRISWISNSMFHTWMGVGCEDPTMNSCTGFASGKKTGEIMIDKVDTSMSSLGEVTILGQLEGDLIADNPGTDSASLIALAPLGMVRWSQYDETAFLMFSNINASDKDPLLGGDSYAMAWELEHNRGFIVTGQGRIVSFIPMEEVDDGTILDDIFGYAIAACLIGMILGLIYWVSPPMQRAYARMTGRLPKGK